MKGLFLVFVGAASSCAVNYIRRRQEKCKERAAAATAAAEAEAAAEAVEAARRMEEEVLLDGFRVDA